VPYITAPESALIERLVAAGLPGTGSCVQRTFNRPAGSICDIDGRIVPADDDKPETVKRRITGLSRADRATDATIATRQADRSDGAQPIEQVAEVLVDALKSKQIL
jgi:hypothetical protein